MYQSVLNEILVGHETSWILHILLYVFRPGIVAVVLMAMLLAVYYLRSVAKARQHVVNILQDIVRLQAEDKKFLLQSISKFSERSKSVMSFVIFRSLERLLAWISTRFPLPIS